MPTALTAAVTAATFVALYAGHQVGDHAIQRNADAAAKEAPSGALVAAGAHPWTGWLACLRHVGTYTLTQAVALAVVSVVAPLTWYGVVAALAVSAGSHALIDRRWIVRWIIRAKGCEQWPDAPYLIDQSLHAGALLVASVLAAATPGARGLGLVVLAVAGIIVAALIVEQRAARTVRVGR